MANGIVHLRHAHVVRGTWPVINASFADASIQLVAGF
jgi:hypothetical protein